MMNPRSEPEGFVTPLLAVLFVVTIFCTAGCNGAGQPDDGGTALDGVVQDGDELPADEVWPDADGYPDGTEEDGDAGGDESGGGDSGGGGNGAPQVIYDGPIGGQLPGWDPDSPRALLAMGTRSGETYWYPTLVRISADGTTSENLLDRVLFFGWEDQDEDAPELLYDGPVGGRLTGWNITNPWPLIMAGTLNGSSDWSLTLARIAPDGTIGENISDRILVWGWRQDGPGVRYDGTVTGGQVSSWDPDAPEPVIMEGTRGNDEWITTLARIDADGSLSENFSDRIIVWGW